MRQRAVGLYIQPLEVLLNALYVYRRTLAYKPEFRREVKEARLLWTYLRNKVHEAPRRKHPIPEPNTMASIIYRNPACLWRHEVKLILRALRFYKDKDHDPRSLKDIQWMLKLFQDHVKKAPTKVLYASQP